MRLILAKVAFYAGSALAGLSGLAFLWVAAGSEHVDGPVAVWLLAAGAGLGVGDALRRWAGRYYF